jgi:ADP-ribose pyrophosphatase
MNDSQPQPWRRRRSRTLFANRWLAIDVDEVILPDGSPYEYTIIRRHAHGVAVMAFDDENRLLLEREYRYPVNQVIWQLPGGLLDPGEDPLTAIQRELAEETGYAAETWEYLGEFWDNPALGDMKIYLYLARGLHNHTATRPDRAEFLTVTWRSWAWVKEAVRTGEIQERVVLAGMGLLMARGWC